MFFYIKKNNLGIYLSLLLIITVVFGIHIYFFKKFSIIDHDFKYHLYFASKIFENNSILSNEIPIHVSTHSLYHILAIVFSMLTGLSLQTAGYYLVPLLSYLILGTIIYNRTSRYKFGNNTGFSFSPAIITLCLMLVGPISFFTFPNLFLGYIGITVYHNPTQILATPLALAVFFLVSEMLTKTTLSKSRLLCLGLATVASLMAKPSYIICLLPALLLLYMYKAYKKIFLNSNLVFFFLSINILVLSWQYWLTYAVQGHETATKIIFAPFLVMGHFAGALAPKLLASVLFPATVYLLFFATARKDARLNLAWLTFGIALVYTYFLAESGHRLYHGNFLWGSFTSLFILFVVSMLFLMKEKNIKTGRELLAIKNNPRLSCCIFIFGLHVLSGVLYYGKILCGGWFG